MEIYRKIYIKYIVLYSNGILMWEWLKICLIACFTILFCLLARRDIELKYWLTKNELVNYEKYRKIIKNFKSIILGIFLCSMIAWLIMEYWYNIKEFLCSSPVWFAWIILTVLCTIFLIYQYIILHKITKKW